MSLIGPRPLLPRDQPTNPSVRLLIRPGITGWAQVNGGTLLTPSEKDALDEWYLRNASLWLDFRIILMTARVMIWGQRRPDDALARAQATTARNEPVWPEVIRPKGIALEASMVPRPYMVRSVTPPRAPL